MITGCRCSTGDNVGSMLGGNTEQDVGWVTPGEAGSRWRVSGPSAGAGRQVTGTGGFRHAPFMQDRTNGSGVSRKPDPQSTKVWPT